MTAPVDPSDDRDLEARLHGSWQRAVIRAEGDLADGQLISAALVAGRPPGRQLATRAVLVVAAFALVAVAFVAGWSSHGIAAHVASTGPTANPQATAGSPAPTASASLGPVLLPGQTFPPSLDGQSVVQVGSEADARITAATDDSPIYVSGWLTGTDWNWIPCSEANPGVPAPSATIGSDCVGTLIRAAADGSPALRIFSTATGHPRLERPGAARVQSVLIQVHVHDRGCQAMACANLAVLDRVVMYGPVRVAPELLAAPLPSVGIPADQAVAIARNQFARAAGQPLALVGVVAGPATVVDDTSPVPAGRWEWVVTFVSADGYHEDIAYIDYLDGTLRGTGYGPIPAQGRLP